MGQTLSHGVYLPAEGERNCYSGLASNWNLLDAALGDIDGKASATHTHGNITNDGKVGTTANLPLITGTGGAVQAGSFGNQANTFCEGNDSRLSDARTPVAHTHGNVTNDGKLGTASRALITDSSKNITVSSVSDTELGYLSGVTSAVQTQLNGKADDSGVVHKTGNETVEGVKIFTKIIKNQSENLEIGVIPSSNTDIGYRVVDKNNTTTANLQYSQYTSGNSQLALNLRTKDSNNNIVNKSVMLNTDQYGTWFNFRPSDNSSISLGSTNYRWSAVYSDSYYYGTTAWGLDKDNSWSGNNTYSKPITVLRNTDTGGFVSLNHSSAELGSIPSSDKSETIIFKDKNDENLGYMGIYYDTSGNNYFRLFIRNKFTSGAPSTSGTADYTSFGLRLNADRSKEAVFRANIRPYDTTNNYHLGDSTYKWKTLNGINPGALSLPNLDNDGYADLSSDLTENVQYTYTPAVDGWLALYAQVNGFHAENAVGIFNGDTTLGNNSFRWANNATAAINLQRQTGKYYGSVFLPVRAGYPYLCWLRVNSSTTLGQKTLMFYKAKGNV